MHEQTINPFDNDQLSFLVLCNAEQQYSLWPAYLTLPNGWTCVLGPDTRNACLAYLAQQWTDIRPLSARHP